MNPEAASVSATVLVPHLAQSAKRPELVFHAGNRFAERYELTERIGVGGHGQVWTALDTLTQQRVAIKLMPHDATGGAAPARIRREVTALRRLQIPGVVRLLDEGIDHGAAFLVMERVAGAAFPGAATPVAWSTIARTTEALLEALARVHALGVVHRDLKPANVLVDAEGRPTLLDFGVSHLAPSPANELTAAGHWVGTPSYLAPEQLTGARATPRSDLYAVGVMLFEALGGRLPHAADADAIHARLGTRPPSLRELDPSVPGAVAALVARLLAPAPEERPHSALGVLGELRGERVDPTGAFPWLGSRAPVDALVRAAIAGHSVDLVGASGAGRTRCLFELAAALTSGGRRVVQTTVDARPFASLAPVVTVPADWSSRSLADVIARLARALRARVPPGAVLLVDDADRLDRGSQLVIARARQAGVTVVRALSRAVPGDRVRRVRLAPLREEALRALFEGPDLLLHLREDAARLLHARTGGRPTRVVAQIAAWVRSGIARWSDTRVVNDRAALDQLDAALVLDASALDAFEALPLPPHLDARLAWIALAAPHIDLAMLCGACGEERWRVAAECDELVARGALRHERDGGLAPLRASAALTRWSPAQRARAHRALALASPPVSEARVAHLLACAACVATPDDAPDDLAAANELAEAAVTTADALARAGRLARAVAALEATLRTVRTIASGPEGAPAREALLSQWVVVALAENPPGAADRVLYEVCRERPATERVAHLEALVRAALAVSSGADRARALADSLPPFADSFALDRRRFAARVAAARRGPVADEAAIVAEAAAWSDAWGTPAARACVAVWSAWVRYREGRFVDAAALHAKAARDDDWQPGRVAAYINQGSALLEAGRLGAAAVAARRALGLAAECRHALLEGRARLVLRWSEYRSGRATRVDEAFIDSAERVGLAHFAAFVALNEAAVAFRLGKRTRARELASRAAAPWSREEHLPGAALAKALAIAAGAPPPAEGNRTLIDFARTRLPNPIGIQVVALLSDSPDVTKEDRLWASGVWESSPRVSRNRRLDVLTLTESLARLHPHRERRRRV